ncbi:MAG TPA: hypothetical protein VMW82_00175 [Candidatus Paceibacterota bacterium]|nr:hypothetical protein [Candidatus Paceibacterota bacterium]
MVLKELKPGFTDPSKKLRVWKYGVPITIFINGEAKKQAWTISHWKMPSGRIVFDLAMNGMQCELEKPADVEAKANTVAYTDPKPASTPFYVLDRLNQDQKNIIADQQCDHGTAKNGNSRHHKL